MRPEDTPDTIERSKQDEIEEKRIDMNLIGTFPASDPPSWTLGVETDAAETCREETTPEAPSTSTPSTPPQK